MSRAAGSTPEVGSSRIRTSGRCRQAAASCSRWRMPSGSPDGWLSATCDEVELREASATRAPDLGRPAPGRAGRGGQVGAYRQFLVEREATATCSRPAGGSRGRSASTGRPSSSRSPSLDVEEAGQHLHGRGLAAAVGAEEAEDLAAPDLEADVVDGGEIAEPARQSFGDDRGRTVVGRPWRHDEVGARFVASGLERDDRPLPGAAPVLAMISVVAPSASTRPASIATRRPKRSASSM